jgi:hypothetical protein
MRRITVSLAVVSAIILGSSIAFSQRGQEQNGEGILSVLSKGQSVSLNDIAGRHEITILPNGPKMLGYEVIEVGRDYVVLEDIAHVKEIRIPIYSVKAVVVLNDSPKTNLSH